MQRSGGYFERRSEGPLEKSPIKHRNELNRTKTNNFAQKVIFLRFSVMNTQASTDEDNAFHNVSIDQRLKSKDQLTKSSKDNPNSSYVPSDGHQESLITGMTLMPKIVGAIIISDITEKIIGEAINSYVKDQFKTTVNTKPDAPKKKK